LGELPDDVSRRCVVFANYDLLRRDADVAAEQELHELADRFDVDLQFVLPSPLLPELKRTLPEWVVRVVLLQSRTTEDIFEV